jgi:hypothetical protein
MSANGPSLHVAAFCIQVGFWDKPEVLHQSSPTAGSAIEF